MVQRSNIKDERRNSQQNGKMRELVDEWIERSREMIYNLSKKRSSGGTPSESPLRFRVWRTILLAWVFSSNGSDSIVCQWSKTHCGKAWPEVAARKSESKPKHIRYVGGKKAWSLSKSIIDQKIQNFIFYSRVQKICWPHWLTNRDTNLSFI